MKSKKKKKRLSRKRKRNNNPRVVLVERWCCSGDKGKILCVMVGEIDVRENV